MLELVYLGRGSVDEQVEPAGEAAVDELRSLAAPLQGLRVLHLSATPYGGGVAEILRSEIPLLRDLGLAAEWRLIRGDERFFAVTKSIHNALQGADLVLSPDMRADYLNHSELDAAELGGDYDVIVVHDPQPLPMRSYRRSSAARWIWRCRIDTSAPNSAVWAFLREYVASYDAAVFTAEGFVPPGAPGLPVHIIPPAIDPLSPKNMPLDPSLARRLLSWIGLDVDRPLMTQVSRFDRWKDPFGVLEVYRLARREVPELQLAMVGSMALDDPEAWDIYHLLQAEAVGDAHVQLFTNLTGVGNIEVNAVQRLSDVVVQKSIREGFGVVGFRGAVEGDSGGCNPRGRHPDPDVAGRRRLSRRLHGRVRQPRVWLLRHPDQARQIGGRGHDRVRARYLLTRLLADDLRLYARAVGRGR